MEQAASTQKPVDQSDPKWKPIHGISLDKFAELSAILVKHNITDIDKVNEFVESEGVPMGQWEYVVDGWTKRMGSHVELKTRYSTIYSQFLT